MMTIPNNRSATRQSFRERLSLDPGWLFHAGDLPMPELRGHYASYMNAKAGTAWGAAAPDFDDGNWGSGFIFFHFFRYKSRQFCRNLFLDPR
jgi:hypothetical protein